MSTDPIGQGVQKATEKLSAPKSGVEGISNQPASQKDVNQFQQALGNNPGQAGTMPSITGSTGLPSGSSGVLSSTGTSSTGNSLGDSILSGIQKLGSSRQGIMQDIQSISQSNQGGALGVQDMMKLQFDLMQMSTEQQIVSKAASSAATGAKTLFQNQ